jgi:hypothetical protein
MDDHSVPPVPNPEADNPVSSEAAAFETGARAGDTRNPWTLFQLFRTYRGRILLTYGLLNLEDLLGLAQPFVLGLAINGLLRSSYRGAVLLVLQHLSHMLISMCRRMYDTRAFTAIYTDLATALVVDQRDRQVDVSRVVARSALSRHLVDFFEHDVPMVLQAVYSVAGALVMLAFFDALLVPLCLALLVPAFLLNRVYSRQTLVLNRHLNDQLEREVEVVGQGQPQEVRGHYRLLAGWRVKLSDAEATNFAVMEFFVLGLIVAALLRRCLGRPDTAPGDIFAIFSYIMMFIQGIDSIPMFVQQMNRIKDIGRRME